MKEKPCITIHPQAKKHGLSVTLLGVSLLLITLIISDFFWMEMRLPLIFLYLVSIIFIFIGVVKLLEPEISFIITPDNINYRHRCGSWQIQWQNIRNINPIKQTQGLSFVELPFIGIGLIDIDKLMGNISPRLANRLIHEQKILITYALHNNLITLEQSLINFSPFLLKNCTQIKGPIAAYLHQSTVLFQAFGAHLYIPLSTIDRDLDAFCILLRRCKASHVYYQ